MMIEKDRVGVNLSPSQRRVVYDPNHAVFLDGVFVQTEPGSSGRVFVEPSRLDLVLSRLKALLAAVEADPAYQDRKPAKVVSQLLRKFQDAKDAHERAYPYAPPTKIVPLR